MLSEKPTVLMVGQPKAVIVDRLKADVSLKILAESDDKDEFIGAISQSVRALAVTYMEKIDSAFMKRLPRLELVSSFGVGYDHIDIGWAKKNGIAVTNTPDVLTEEVADATIGLLLRTVRAAGTSLRLRTLGIVGMGRIGGAIAKRLEAFGRPIAYSSRTAKKDIPYRYYPDLLELAHDVNTLIVVVPGGPSTVNLIGRKVLETLGPNGILINVARGSVVDEPALIEALENKVILSAGLDVFASEPNVPAALISMDHITLLPHIASATVYTRMKMDQLVADNILAWTQGKSLLTPV